MFGIITKKKILKFIEQENDGLKDYINYYHVNSEDEKIKKETYISAHREIMNKLYSLINNGR